MSTDCSFRFAEKCLYEYPANCAALERQVERLDRLYASSSMKAQGYEPVEHNGEPGDPVGQRTLEIMALEDRIEKLESMTEPVKNLMRALDAPFVLEGTALEGLADVARMYYFARRPKDEIAAKLGVSRRTIYYMREKLVNLVIKYAEQRIECAKSLHNFCISPCYTDSVE